MRILFTKQYGKRSSESSTVKYFYLLNVRAYQNCLIKKNPSFLVYNRKAVKEVVVDSNLKKNVITTRASEEPKILVFVY